MLNLQRNIFAKQYRAQGHFERIRRNWYQYLVVKYI